MNIRYFLLAVVLCVFTGCASQSGNKQLGKMKGYDVERYIQKGTTTKLQIKDIFGDPQEKSFKSNGNEQWKYTFVKSREKGLNYIPVVNWFVKGTNDDVKMLVVVFDEHGVVIQYAVSSSKGETKTGLF